MDLVGVTEPDSGCVLLDCEDALHRGGCGADQTVDDGRQNQHKGGHRDTISFPTVSLVQTVTGVGTEIELFLHFQWDVCQVHLVLLFSVVK